VQETCVYSATARDVLTPEIPMYSRDGSLFSRAIQDTTVGFDCLSNLDTNVKDTNVMMEYAFDIG